MQMLRAENIVRIMDVMESRNNYYIVQEMCDLDLEKHLRERGKLGEEQAILFLSQICKGFITLAREGIVHRYPNADAGTSSRPTCCSARGSSRSGTSGSPKRTSTNA